MYKKCIFDQKFWAKIPWSEVYKNCVSDRIQWSEMTKTFGHYCSLKMLWQIIIWHLDLEQSGAWISCHIWPNCAFSDKSTKIGIDSFVCFELIRCGAIGPWPQWSVGASPMSKYGQKLKTFRKVERTLFLNRNGHYWILSCLIFSSFFD